MSKTIKTAPVPAARRWPHLLMRASAGTGKTFQLSNRYLDLLAGGVACDEILATTFTRKAAGEILERILFRLAAATHDEKERQTLGAHLACGPLSREQCLDLLAQATRNLHRLRVGTLDSFFMSIAGSFSLELGLPADWSIADEVTDRALRIEAMRTALAQDATADLVNLMHLLSKGETNRSVTTLVHDTVNDLYSIFLESDEAAWQRLQPSAALSAEEVDAILAALEAVAMPTAQIAKGRDGDVEKVRGGDWDGFIKGGIAAKVLVGEDTYYRKPIADETAQHYQQLLAHARAELLNPVVRYNHGAWQLLAKFDEEYQHLKRTRGLLRFDDVTRLVARSAALSAERLGHRLDGGIRHLLLDEFQDTSRAQWQVLRGFAKQVTSTADDGSFFCVGDVKQAIYGWRGGVAQLFDTLSEELTGIEPRDLAESFRSSPAVIDTVNAVFANIHQHGNLERFESAILRWQSGFPVHKTARGELPGYAVLRVLPTVPDEADDKEFRDRYVAEYVERLMNQSPGRSIGVIVSKNDTVRRMIYALRELGIDASEEGGNPLTDSAAVELILSVLQLADHPGDSVARFHVARSRLGSVLEFTRHDDDRAASELASKLRRRLLDLGYGQTVLQLAKLLAPFCNDREMRRLDQLVELAYRYEPRGAMRADVFVAAVREERVADPTPAAVRVMNVHQCKGLEFDIVVLPELDELLSGQTPAFVAGRGSPTGPVTAVCRYVNADVQAFLPAEFQRMFDAAADQDVAEEMCVLYVALTRARHALHMLVSAAKAGSQKPGKTFAGLLRGALCAGRPLAADSVANELGQPDWARGLAAPVKTAEKPALQTPSITFAEATGGRRRGWRPVSPSQLEGNEQRRMADVFRADRAAGQHFGTLMHAWLAEIVWLDEAAPDSGLPSEQRLRQIAVQLGRLPTSIYVELKQFRDYLTKPGLKSVLSQNSYRAELAKRFPRAAGSGLSLHVVNERRFAQRAQDQLMTGSIDRLVLVQEGNRVVAADVIDFKTDVLDDERDKLAKKVEYYRPQLAAYRRAVAQNYRLDEKQVAARLVFLASGEVVDVK